MLSQRYSPRSLANLTNVVLSIFLERYMRGVNNSFGTWEKVQLQETESKPSVHFLYSNKFIFSRHADSLSFFMYIKEGNGLSIHAVQSTHEVPHRLINLSPSNPHAPTVVCVSKEC